MSFKELVLPISFGVVTASTVIGLLGFIIYDHNTCKKFDEDGYCEEESVDEDGNRRDNPEAAQGRKLTFAMAWLMITALSVAAAGFFTWWKKSATAFRIGTLGGSTLLLANMAVVCTLYFWSFASEEEEDDDDDDDQNNNRNLRRDDDYDTQDEHVFAIISLVLAAVYTILSVFILRSHEKESDSAEEEADSPADESIKSQAYIEILSDVWKGISIISFVPFFILAFVTSIPLFDEEEAERVREDGYIWNLIFLVLWMVAGAIGVILIGRRVLGGASSRLELGAFAGGLLVFAAIEFMLAALYGSFQGEEGREEGRMTLGSTGFSFLCIFLFFVHALFAAGIFKYRESLFQAVAMDTRAKEGFAFSFRPVWGNHGTVSETVSEQPPKAEDGFSFHQMEGNGDIELPNTDDETQS